MVIDILRQMLLDLLKLNWDFVVFFHRDVVGLLHFQTLVIIKKGFLFYYLKIFITVYDMSFAVLCIDSRFFMVS